MRLLDAVHAGYVHRRRVRVLGALIAETLPPGARVLDVGCGDGLLDRVIADQRPDVDLRGIDVLVRERTSIPVDQYDGRTLPFDTGSFDAVMFVDVLHHTDDPLALLREGVRVSRCAVVIKDHLCGGRMDKAVLQFTDWVGNDRHGVSLPYNYWHPRQWDDAFRRLDLAVVSWRDRLGLYPAPASWLFDRSLQFLARADKK